MYYKEGIIKAKEEGLECDANAGDERVAHFVKRVRLITITGVETYEVYRGKDDTGELIGHVYFGSGKAEYDPLEGYDAEEVKYAFDIFTFTIMHFLIWLEEDGLIK